MALGPWHLWKRNTKCALCLELGLETAGVWPQAQIQIQPGHHASMSVCLLDSGALDSCLQYFREIPVEQSRHEPIQTEGSKSVLDVTQSPDFSDQGLCPIRNNFCFVVDIVLFFFLFFPSHSG